MAMSTKMIWFTAVLTVLCFACANAASRPKYDLGLCRIAVAPTTMPIGITHKQQSVDKPRFELKVTKTLDLSDSRQQPNEQRVPTYQVHLTAQDEFASFSDAEISVSTDGSCGYGTLKFEPQEFFQVRQNSEECPVLLLTNRKLPMKVLPALMWQPPKCGCVQFRALVLESGRTYYSEDSTVTSGPLAKRVCIKPPKKITREHRLDKLCHVLEVQTGTSILSRDEVRERHRLNLSSKMNLFELEKAIELRRSDARMCCQMPGLQDKFDCFDDARRQRIDTFCAGGLPDIPFTHFRNNHMRKRERDCCYIMGEHRYICFAQNSLIEAGSESSPLDFSMDETDPVNDLSLFGSHEEPESLLGIAPMTTYGTDVEDEDYENDEGRDEIDDVEENNDENDDADDVDDDDDDDIDETEEDKNHVDDKVLSEKLVSLKKEMKKKKKKSQISRIKDENTSHATDQDERQHVRYSTVIPSSSQFDLDVKGAAPSEPTKKRKRIRHRKHNRKTSSEFREDTTNSGSKASTIESGKINSPAQSETQGIVERRESSQEKPGVSSRRRIQKHNKRKTNEQKRLRLDRNWKTTQSLPVDDETMVDKTLNKLEKQLRRIQIRKECCSLGTSVGNNVYGILKHVRDECLHSALKHVDKLNYSFGWKICKAQYVQCCLEVAKTGPTMTSSEFRDIAYPQYQRGGPNPSTDSYSESLQPDAWPDNVLQRASEENYEDNLRAMPDLDSLEDNGDDEEFLPLAEEDKNEEFFLPRKTDDANNHKKNRGKSVQGLERKSVAHSTKSRYDSKNSKENAPKSDGQSKNIKEKDKTRKENLPDLYEEKEEDRSRKMSTTPTRPSKKTRKSRINRRRLTSRKLPGGTSKRSNKRRMGCLTRHRSRPWLCKKQRHGKPRNYRRLHQKRDPVSPLDSKEMATVYKAQVKHAFDSKEMETAFAQRDMGRRSRSRFWTKRS